jgi:hypothetical protein
MFDWGEREFDVCHNTLFVPRADIHHIAGILRHEMIQAHQYGIIYGLAMLTSIRENDRLEVRQTTDNVCGHVEV